MGEVGALGLNYSATSGCSFALAAQSRGMMDSLPDVAVPYPGTTNPMMSY